MVSCFQRITTKLRVLLRDFVLVVCVGILGSQILLQVSGGFPLVQRAEAFMGEREQIPLDYDIVLEPSNPSHVRMISIVTSKTHDGPVFIRVTNDDRPVISCYSTDNVGDWDCPTPGLRVLELEKIQVFTQ